MYTTENKFCTCGELLIIEYDVYAKKFFVECFSCGFIESSTSENDLIDRLKDHDVY